MRPCIYKAGIIGRVIKKLVEKTIFSKDALVLCAGESAELSLKKMQFEEFKLNQEFGEQECETQYEGEKLKFQIQGGLTPREFTKQEINMPKYLRMVSVFDETDPDDFFTQFERVADCMKWPSEHRVMLAHSALKGKPQAIFNSLDNVSDYEFVKIRTLKGYERVPEAYRLGFRNLKKIDSTTCLDFAYTKHRQFGRWLLACKVKDYDGLKGLILLEGFKRQMNPAIKVYLEEKRASDCN